MIKLVMQSHAKVIFNIRICEKQLRTTFVDYF